MKFKIENEINDIEKAHPEDIPFNVRLGDIQFRKSSATNKYFKSNPLKFFKLRMLKKSLKDNGYDPSKFGHISLAYDSSIDKYIAFDGSQRLLILKDLYGDEHEIEAVRHITCNDCGDINWDLQIAHTPVMAFFIIYALLPTIVLIIVLYLSYFYLPDFKINMKLHKHPVNGLRWLHTKSEIVYSFIMGVYYNTNYIINILILLTYLTWTLYDNFYICMAMIGTQLILTQTLIHFKLEEVRYGDVIKKLKFW